MSWSDERTKESQRSADEIIEKIHVVNSVLRQLALDSNLTDDLSDPMVKIAIKHWTNEERLSPEEAKKLEDHYRVHSILKKLHLLQHSCKSLGMPVPLDHFLARRNMLSEKLIADRFGEQILTIMMMSSPPATPYSSDKPATPHLPMGTTSKSSNTKTSTSTNAVAGVGAAKPPVEFGPQLPQQLSKHEEKTAPATAALSWGKEPYGSPEFTWFKFLTRTTLELLLATGLAIAVGMFMNAKTSKANTPLS